jgi:ABC-type sugar transport system substrate-binding protein
MRKQVTTSRPGPLATMTAAIMLGLAATTFGAPVFAQSSAEPVSPLPDCSGGTIGATLLSLDYPLLATLNDSMAAEAQRLGVDLLSLDPRQRTDTEFTQIRDLISKQVDAIIMIPVDGTNSQTAAKEVNAADIPLIEVNTKLGRSFFDDGGTIATYVGSDDQAGEIQAHHIGSRGNPVRVIYLVDEDGGASSDLRKEGFTKVMGEHPGFVIAFTLDGHGSRAEGKALMEELLEIYGYRAFDGVVSQDDEMVLGALSAIEAAGRRDEFEILLGVGAGPEALQSIVDGGLTASVFQDAVGQGIGAIQAACRIVAGQDVLPNTSIPFELVTTESVDQFME